MLELFKRVIEECVPSEDMRKAMIEQGVSKEDLVTLILNAPVWIGIKERCLLALTETDDPDSKCRDELNGADIETCDAGNMYDRVRKESAGKHLEMIREAHRELLEMKSGEILYLKEAWYDEEVLDEYMKEKGAAAFTSFDAVRDHIRRMMGEEEWDEDTCCWNVLEKWTPGMDGVMCSSYYRLKKVERWELPEDEQVLLKVQEYIWSHEIRGAKGHVKRKRKRGERIDRLFSGHGELGGKTDEELVKVLEKLIGAEEDDDQ